MSGPQCLNHKQQAIAACIRELDALQPGDTEKLHVQADSLIKNLLLDINLYDVAIAYERAQKRCNFQYA